MIQYTDYEERDISATPRHRQQMSRGCFRYVPDTYYDQVENWKELAYLDQRPPYMRRAKQKRF